MNDANREHVPVFDGAAAEFENYTETSKHYDETRVPLGVEIILGCLAASAPRLQDQVVLDGGCGTGNYTVRIRSKLASVHGLEINEGMLAQARRKAESTDNVVVTHGNLADMPYDDDMFDGITINQVLHHLDVDADAKSVQQQVFSEIFRVVRPGGVVVINTSSHTQLRDGFWWADLIPDAVGRIIPRFSTPAVTRRMLEDAGLDFEGMLVPVDAVLQAGHYLDSRGPLDKSYRDGDSTWSLASDEELARGLERLRRMHEDGSIDDYMASRERLRMNVGQTIFIYAMKPSR